MNKDRIFLSTSHMGGNEQKYVQEAFDTKWIAPLGPNVTGFENSLQDYLDNGSYVAALSSGTAAIHLGLILLGIKMDDEVICQSMTFSASANPILYLGAKPIFIDSEPDTWNICPISLEKAILDRISKGKKPKAIIAVHLYGMPYKVNELNELSLKYDIPILEDSAEALGSSFNGVKCGTFGEIGVLSFNGNKIITTSGGGALISSSLKVKEKAVFLATQAKDEAPHYQHSEIGYNYRLSNVCAGIGRGQMEVLDKHVGFRRNNHEFYESSLSNIEGITFLKELEGVFCNRWLSCILFDSFEKKEQVRLALENENIESRPLWKPMHMQPIFESAPFYGGDIAKDLFNRGLCVPSGSNLTENDLNRVVSVIKALF